MLQRGLAAAKRAGIGARFASIDAKAVTIERYGSPAAVLKFGSVKVDDTLQSGEVLLKMLAAPITVTDLSMVKGFNTSSSTPKVGGNEGLAVVEKVGSGVSGLKTNDIVVPAVPELGTWCTHTVVSEKDVVKVSDSVPASVERAAASIAAPGVALRLLDDFAALSEGDVIIQNNAGSTVAQAVVQLAAKRGIKTVNIMRERADQDDYIAHLQGLGATVVVDSEFAKTPEFAALMKDLPAPKLALNGSGGDAARVCAKSLADNGVMVTYGASSGKPLTLPADVFIGKDITLKGFNLARWMAAAGPEERDAFIRRVYTLTADDDLSQLLATEPFNDFSHALKRATEAGERKVVLNMQ